MSQTYSRILLAILFASGITLGLRAAPPAPFRITVPDIHCVSCAKNIAGKLNEVPGVAQVQANVPAKMLTVIPRGQQMLSPRALWEAVENAGYRPTVLQGPGGTFTKKPQS